MPSGCAAPTSMVLISFNVLESNMDTCGWSLVKPWPDFGSTTQPFPPTPEISPAGSSVSRLKIVSRFGIAGTSGVVSVAATARGIHKRRPAVPGSSESYSTCVHERQTIPDSWSYCHLQPDSQPSQASISQSLLNLVARKIDQYP